jgi:predicted dehydrogenase
MKVKFAVIGCGRIAPSHLVGIKNAPHAELVAVCDVVEETAKKQQRTTDFQSGTPMKKQ